MGAALPLALFWLLYLGGLGLFLPFFGLYLRENAGLSGTQVGLVLAAMPLVGIAAQPWWGQLADRSGRRVVVLAALTLGAALGQVALFTASGFAGLFATTALLAGFGTSVIPQAIAVSLAALGDPSARAFGRVRVWGTLGFLVCVVGFPRLLDRFQAAGWFEAAPGVSEPGLELLFPGSALLFAGAAAAALAVPRGGAQALRARRGEWRTLIRHRPVWGLLMFAFAAYLCLQGPMGIFPIFARARGGDMGTIGNLWVLMLLLEVPLVLWTGASLERLGPRGLLALGVLSSGVRWTVCGLSDSTAAVYAVQVLHGVGVAGIVIGAPLYLEAAVPERLRSTAQSFLAMFAVGLGGVASNAGAGWLLDHVGPTAPYTVGGIGALACGAFAWALPRPVRPLER